MISKSGVGLLISKQGVVDKQALSAASETVAKGIYDATTLSAVDTDLAVGNIKNGVDIFGKVGTVTLAEDVEGDAETAETANTDTGFSKLTPIGAGVDVILATKTLAFDSNSLAFAVGFAATMEPSSNIKLRLYMGGVQLQETEYLAGATVNYILRDFKALSGSQTCYVAGHNYDTSSHSVEGSARTTNPVPYVIAVGSVKLT